MAEMTFAALAQQMALAAAQMPREEQRGLREAGEIILAEAKGRIGHYQSATGPFPAWPALADATVKDRVAHGFSSNEPLLRDGELRDSYGAVVRGRTTTVGSHNPKAGWMETGTRRMPPRPVVGPAMVAKLDEAGDAIANAVFTPFFSRRG